MNASVPAAPAAPAAPMAPAAPQPAAGCSIFSTWPRLPHLRQLLWWLTLPLTHGLTFRLRLWRRPLPLALKAATVGRTLRVLPQRRPLHPLLRLRPFRGC